MRFFRTDCAKMAIFTKNFKTSLGYIHGGSLIDALGKFTRLVAVSLLTVGRILAQKNLTNYPA
jgi:hypothetical protein